MALTTLTRYSISPDVCSSTDQDGTIILSIGKGKVYSIIGEGSIIWNIIASNPFGIPKDKLVDQIKNEHSDIPQDYIYQGVDHFLCNLIDMGLIKNYINESNLQSITNNSFISKLIAISVFILRPNVKFLLRTKFYAISAFILLIIVDATLLIGNYKTMRYIIKTWSNSNEQLFARDKYQLICNAVDQACRWYRKDALCLQRSAVATCMFRELGVKANMVIGCRKMPYYGHAWVEVNGEVINDTSKVKEILCELDRF